MATSVANTWAQTHPLLGTKLTTSRSTITERAQQVEFKSSHGLRKPSVAVRCTSQVQVLESGTAAEVRHVNNPAEELLEMWANKPVSKNSETEAVRRLFMWESLPKQEKVQVFSVYEINEHDRDSPAFLPFSAINVAKTKAANGNSLMEGLHSLWSTLSGDHKHGLGDLVPFSNKLYDSSLRVRLGVTAGLTMVVKAYPGRGQKFQKEKFFFPDRYEAIFTFYLGDMGHISAQGPFSTFEDSLLTVTGGAGLFREAKGVIHLHNITPFKLFYTFHIRGVPDLPRLLTATAADPSVQPCRQAAECRPGFVLPNYSD